MKHLKKFENFYLNDMESEQSGEQSQDIYSDEYDLREKEMEEDDCETCDHEEEEEAKVWGDEAIEEKKSTKFKKKEVKKDDKKGDDEKEVKGLTAKQKKLPIGLQRAILKNKKK
jgi:hypothetical protein